MWLTDYQMGGMELGLRLGMGSGIGDGNVKESGTGKRNGKGAGGTEVSVRMPVKLVRGGRDIKLFPYKIRTLEQRNLST